MKLLSKSIAMALTLGVTLAITACSGERQADTATAATPATTGKIKVGFMMPYTGTYAALGNAMENGFRQYVDGHDGKLGGYDVEFVRLDDESDPAKATDNVNKLIMRDKVDILVGTAHSGVALAMARAAKESGTLFFVTNAGVNSITGPLCAENIFRSSFSMWQSGYAMGEVMAERGHKRVVTITWKYSAGDESTGGFREAFEENGGEVVRALNLPFPNVEFQALLTEIAALKPDAVYTFFAGAGAVKFVNDYAAAGLKDRIPLYGAGFLTDGTLEAQGASADGLMTTLHYADGLDSQVDREFRQTYSEKYKLVPDVYAVQGYDAAQMAAIGLEAVGGDVSRKADFAAAIRGATIHSPRGDFTMSRAHNPVQDIYLRQVSDKENRVVEVASAALADPARGCTL